MKSLKPCLWFDNQAEDAANFYVSIFKNAKILRVAHYPKAGFEQHRRPEGSVMTVEFELMGLTFTALNGGPIFKFNESVSFEIPCKDQEEVDYYWTKLGAGGDERAQQCGWLKDKFGLSWQVVPEVLPKLMTDPDNTARERVFAAMMKMKKLDVAELEKAAKG
jgi:predicted 3-demethylubiquinone-9 3-methyltransferase (glyoxalase superfamily)